MGWFFDLEDESSRVNLNTSFSKSAVLYGKWEKATEGLVFELINDEYHVIKYQGMSSEVIIPQYYKGIIVTTIEEEAFKEHELIKKVTLPPSIIKIKQEAFKDAINLTKINFPSSLETIDKNAFHNCLSLKVSFIDAIVIGEGAFDSCSGLTNITLSNRVEVIEKWAFFSNSSLQTVTIYETISEIHDHAFSWSRDFTFYTPAANIIKLEELLSNIVLIYVNYKIEELSNS